MEVDDIFRRLKEVETFISELQAREDKEGELSANDLANLRARLALHHSLLK